MQQRQLKAILSQLGLKLAAFKQQLASLQSTFDSFNSEFIVLEFRKSELISKHKKNLKYQIADLFLLELNQIHSNLAKLEKILSEYTTQIQEIRFNIDCIDKSLEKFKGKLRQIRKLRKTSVELFASEEVETIVIAAGMIQKEHGSSSYH